MDSPLSALSPSKANALGSKIPTPMNLTPSKTPLKSQTGNINKTPILVHSNLDEDEINWDEGPSSPFLSEVVEHEDKENQHSMASRSTSSTAPTEVIPRSQDDIGAEPTPRPTVRTPFKIAEDETCTFHTSKSTISTSPSKALFTRTSNHESHESVTVTSQSLHESRSSHRVISYGTDIGDMTLDDPNIDDTCFSTFSEVPNTDMTAFAKLGQRSPTKQMLFDQTPRQDIFNTPGTARTRLAARSPSPTPRRNMANLPQYQDSSDTTNLLLDFTQQFEASTISQQQRSPSRRSPTKQTAEPQLLSYFQNQRSPVKGSRTPATPRTANKQTQLLNLLDFELPPAPTPRSIPSITVREMESLKSKYSSEISSLRATLSGREAEVEALKRAVGDAERRVGDAIECSREERSKREFVEKEKEEWERRGRDFEDVLRKVKEEVLEAEKERAEMLNRIEEAEERARDAESRAADAEARAIEAATKIVHTNTTSSDDQKGPVFTAEQVQKQIDEKVHTLSTELHTIYKKKHVTKVAGLKKGFEAKTKEKTAELQARIDELEKKNDELQAKMDATFSGVLPANLASRLTDADLDPEQRERDTKRLEEQNALIERQKAELVGREEEIRTAHAEFASLMKDLERERIEKGELVAAVDEMLMLQNDITTVNVDAGNAVEDFKKSIGGIAARPSGLRAPGGFGFSKIAAPPAMSRSTSGGKSRMMSNIERMAKGGSLE